MKPGIGERIAVVGAGRLGHAIAQVFLAAGHQVALYDPDAEILAQASSQIADVFGLLEQDPDLLLNLSLYEDLPSAVIDADAVIEAVPEKLELKRDIFVELSRLTKPSAILATNTSALPIGEIAKGNKDAHRIIGTHFWNPPYLVRLVEVIESELTAAAVVDQCMKLLDGIRMKPVHVKRDIPGFIGNRLQHAMKREAIALVADGVCDAETIDTVVKHGFGSRLAVLGPLEQSDMVGLDLTLDILGTLYPTLDNTSDSPALLVDKVRKGELGMSVGKGFREWTPESARKVRDDLTKFLVASAKARDEEP